MDSLHPSLPISYLSNVYFLNFEKAALQGPTTAWVDLKVKTVHPVNKSLEPAGIRNSLAAEESFVRHSSQQLASDMKIGLVAEFFYDFMGRRGVEYIMLDRTILVIELVDQSKWGNCRHSMTKSCLPEFDSDSLWSIVSHFTDIPPLKLQ
jgi:hypothetical protein